MTLRKRLVLQREESEKHYQAWSEDYVSGAANAEILSLFHSIFIMLFIIIY